MPTFGDEVRILKVGDANAEARAADPLRDFFSRWDSVAPSDVSAFRKALDEATREEDIQQFLQNNPKYLIQHLGGGHGRWVIPKKRLGGEHVTDFMIGERDSLGFHWVAVELETPLSKMFVKSGDPSATLNHAVRQITDWRSWLSVNQNYAARPLVEGGLGLTDIAATIPGLILMGRRATESGDTKRRRRQMAEDLKIEIHTYDYLLDSLEGRVKSLDVRHIRKID